MKKERIDRREEGIAEPVPSQNASQVSLNPEQQVELERRVQEIKDSIKRAEKFQRVTKETLDLEFTI